MTSNSSAMKDAFKSLLLWTSSSEVIDLLCIVTSIIKNPREVEDCLLWLSNLTDLDLEFTNSIVLNHMPQHPNRAKSWLQNIIPSTSNQAKVLIKILYELFHRQELEDIDYSLSRE